MEWFNWFGLILYTIAGITARFTRPKTKEGNNKNNKNTLLFLSVIFSVFHITPFCFSIPSEPREKAVYYITSSLFCILFLLFSFLASKSKKAVCRKIVTVCFFSIIFCDALLSLNLTSYLFLFGYFVLTANDKAMKNIQLGSVIVAEDAVHSADGILEKPTDLYHTYHSAEESFRQRSVKAAGKSKNYRKAILAWLDKLFTLYPNETFNDVSKVNYHDGNQVDIHHEIPKTQCTDEQIRNFDNLIPTSRKKHNEIHNENSQEKLKNPLRVNRTATRKDYLSFCAVSFIALILSSLIFGFLVSFVTIGVSMLFTPRENRVPFSYILSESLTSALRTFVYAVPIGIFCIGTKVAYSKQGLTFSEWKMNGIQIVFTLFVILLTVYRQSNSHHENPDKVTEPTFKTFLFMLFYSCVYFAGELIEACLTLPVLAETIISIFYMLIATAVIQTVFCLKNKREKEFNGG